MKFAFRLLLLLFAGAAAPIFAHAENPGPEASATKSATPETKDVHKLAPVVRGEALVARVMEARKLGFAHLVASQNSDGSWGSHDPHIAALADFGFKLRNRGSQDAVRMACTAICASALLVKSDRTKAESEALERAAESLIDESKFAYHLGETFNTWGYGYKLDFLTKYLDSPLGRKDRKRIEKAAAKCIKSLRRYQQVDGGWNYYSSPVMDSESMSFTTANYVLALQNAKRLGIEVPQGMIEDAASLLKRMRTKRGTFVYDARFLHDPLSVNELSAGGRTAVCTLALRNVGVYGEDDLLSSIRIFGESENYLESGRKLIVPHSAVHQISGYFFFYGYNYASEVASLLGDKVDHDRWDRFAWTMVRTQEANGSWWDTASGQYGDKWGTGFALLTIERYLNHIQQR